MPDSPSSKYRNALDLLQRGREVLVERLADEILEQGEDLLEGGFQFHELLETHGMKLHFLGVLLAHLEQSAEACSLPPESAMPSTSSTGATDDVYSLTPAPDEPPFDPAEALMLETPAEPAPAKPKRKPRSTRSRKSQADAAGRAARDEPVDDVPF
jgi:hypothetical protein